MANRVEKSNERLSKFIDWLDSPYYALFWFVMIAIVAPVSVVIWFKLILPNL